jgi:hypothetical protein
MCTIILQNPDDMVLWLKFASDNLTINSACTDDHIIQLNDPDRLPDNRGQYRNWGAFFNFNDVLEIQGGIDVKEKYMHQWSVSFWMNLPLENNTGQPHVLVQSVAGKGAYVQIDASGKKLQCVCELTGRIVTA